jgi:thiamine pyrophosphate-dependent acetolactate synthase large subunit-like protein
MNMIQTRKPIAAHLIARLIKKSNSKLYTYPGGTIAPLYCGCEESDVQLICAKTEKGAG